MGRRKKDRSASMLDTLFVELVNSSNQANLIDLCLSDNTSSVITSVPKRYRLIALAFHKELSPSELNQMLMREHCAELYVRNYLEASVYFALHSGISYAQWRDLREETGNIYAESMLEPGIFSESSITLNSIKEYVNNNSTLETGIPVTRFTATQFIQNRLDEMDGNTSDFLRFIAENADQFSDVRERTRYYFCKYLMYYLEERKQDYCNSINDSRRFASSLLKKLGSESSVFRVKTNIDRHSYKDEELKAHIDSAPLSPFYIFSAFEDHYFGYINTDWTEIILDNYGSDVPQKFLHVLSREIKRQNKALTAADDATVIRWKLEEMARNEDKKNEKSSRDRYIQSQSGRMGEAFVRDVLKGRRDLDRTTLIAFLLFFQYNSSPPDHHEIKKERLDSILSACGFHKTENDNDVDEFFVNYMEADDSIDYLISQAEELALSESNFYLYKTYINSKSEHQQWEKMLFHR